MMPTGNPLVYIPK